MPAVTVNDWAGLPRIPVPEPALAAERPVASVTTAPAGFEGEGFPVRRAFAGLSPISPRLSRAEVNGFAAYLAGHSALQAGVYSSPPIWAQIFGHGRAARIPHLYEWTYNDTTSSLADQPAGWCLRGTGACARFFGGVTARSRYALMWQWSGGGGTWNGFGDFDQIDGSRTP